MGGLIVDLLFSGKGDSTEGLSFFNGNAFHSDPIFGFAPLTAVAHGGWSVADVLQNIFTFDQFSEGGVLSIQKTGFRQANEKLAARGVRVLGTGHGDDSFDMGTVVKFGLNLVSGSACADLRVIFFAQGVAALDHKPFDDTMKSGSVIKSFAGELDEIFDCFWSNLRPELEFHGSGVGCDDCDG